MEYDYDANSLAIRIFQLNEAYKFFLQQNNPVTVSLAAEIKQKMQKLAAMTA